MQSVDPTNNGKNKLNSQSAAYLQVVRQLDTTSILGVHSDKHSVCRVELDLCALEQELLLVLERGTLGGNKHKNK